jgi:hypothetical protein
MIETRKMSLPYLLTERSPIPVMASSRRVP